MKKKKSTKKTVTISKRNTDNLSIDRPVIHSKEKLLEAAFVVFAKKGFHGASTKAISTEAGVNEALITRHFQTKLGLFLAVIENKVAPSPTSLPYPPQNSLASELICFSNHIFETSLKNADLIRILIGHGLLDVEFASYIRARLKPPFSELLHSRIENLKKENKLSAKADSLAIQSVIRDLNLATFIMSVLLKASDDKKALSETKYLIKMFCKGLEHLD